MTDYGEEVVVLDSAQRPQTAGVLKDIGTICTVLLHGFSVPKLNWHLPKLGR